MDKGNETAEKIFNLHKIITLLFFNNYLCIRCQIICPRSNVIIRTYSCKYIFPFEKKMKLLFKLHLKSKRKTSIKYNLQVANLSERYKKFFFY